jgi:hypothetical protein
MKLSNFFKAQVEANKVIQYSLLADWRRDRQSAGPRTHRFSCRYPARAGPRSNGTDRRISRHSGLPIPARLSTTSLRVTRVP